MKISPWLAILFGVQTAGQGPDQFDSYLGCYKDDKNRDLKLQGPQKHGGGKNIKECRDFAKKEGARFFGLQNGGECYAGNKFGTTKSYYEIQPAECQRGTDYRCGNEEHKAYCGAAWANAIYSTKPVPALLTVQARKPMQIVSPWGTRYCMYGQLSDSNVYMKDCNWRNDGATEKSFLWSFDKKSRIISQHPNLKGKCLDVNNDKNIYMHKCHGGKNQKFFWKNGANLGTEQNNDCMDWNTGKQHKDQLYMGGCHKGENQNFWWNTGEAIESKWQKDDRKYLSAPWDLSAVDLWKVPGNTQKWSLIEVDNGYKYYNIKLTGGMFNGRGIGQYNAYMSTDKNGKVDIWKTDDGSGRQRWNIKKLDDGYFSIAIAQGTNGGKVWLTANNDSTQMYLDAKFQNIDRQKWKLSKTFIPTPKPTPKPTPQPTPQPMKGLKSGMGWTVSQGKCTIDISTGVPCAVSSNFPKPYSDEESCKVKMTETKAVKPETFETEKYFDNVKIGDVKLNGKLEKTSTMNLEKGVDTIEWSSDFYLGATGWKICKTKYNQPDLPKDKKMKG